MLMCMLNVNTYCTEMKNFLYGSTDLSGKGYLFNLTLLLNLSL